MSVRSDINNVREINANSTRDIIGISNENFFKIREALRKLLDDFKYDENSVSITGKEITTDVLNVTRSLSLVVQNMEKFRVDGNGRLFTKEAMVEGTVKSPCHTHNYYEGFPIHGNNGDIVYGRNANHPVIDFYGYINNIGWVSLTGLSQTGEPGDVLNMPFAVTDILDEETIMGLSGGGPYIVSDGEHKGSVALWDGANSKWEFVTFPENSYTINTNDGKIYVSGENEFGETSWTPIEESKSIGPDESGSYDYSDGQYDDFNGDTQVGTAIDRFNKDIKKLYSRSYVAFKNVEGVAHTDVEKHYSDESYPGGVTVPAGKVFVSDISDKDAAIEAGLVTQKTGVLTRIGTTNTYVLKEGGNPTHRVVSKAFGNGYDITVYDSNGVEIDPNDYIYQYASGVLLYIGGQDITPTRIKYYKYIGETVEEKLSGVSARLSYADNEKHVSASVSNNMKNNPNSPSLTGLFVSEEPKKKSDFVVKVNGLAVRVGKDKDCYFNKSNTSKTFENIEQGDELVWNSQNVGYILDEDDVVTFDYLVYDGAGGGVSPSPTPGGGSVTVLLTAGENIPAYSFVHIVDDRTVILADSEIDTETEADGFVVDTVSEGEEVTVYLSGVLDVPSVNGTVGDYVYLQSEGQYNSAFDADTNFILQNVASIVDTDKLYIHIYEPIVLR